MSVVTFWNGTRGGLGNTSSSIAYATQVAVEHNIKVLLISTSLNDDLIGTSFWKEKKQSIFASMGLANKDKVNQNGVEGLDRLIRSNKVSPDIITDYTKVVLTNRLEILPGMIGDGQDYDIMKERYVRIIDLAKLYYDMVVVDLDKRIGKNTDEILKLSDIVVAMVPQRMKEIEKISEMMKNVESLNKDKTLMVIAKYMEDTKYNVKNISKNILKQKEDINIIPYNKLFFEASQEGSVADLFISFMRIKNEDENYFFTESIKKLHKDIKNKLDELKFKVR